MTRQDWEPIASLGVLDQAAWRAVQNLGSTVTAGIISALDRNTAEGIVTLTSCGQREAREACAA